MMFGNSKAKLSKSFYVMDNICLDDEQIDAYNIISTSKKNFFITGKAGTGKSLLLKFYTSNVKKNVVVLAPTGIAAINVSGQTIHSFFELKPQIQNVTDNLQILLNNQQKALYKSLDTIIIDEISMVRCDVIDMIDTKLKLARDSALPFGGCQIIVFGDLFQLPPVVGRDENEIKYIFDSYGSEFFFAAPVVQEYPFEIIELKNIHRQKDIDYINNLNLIRIGNNDFNTLKFFNKRLEKLDKKDNIITLTPKRIAAEIVNRERLNKINSKEYIYHGIVEGEFSYEDLPADEELHLKVGAQIIMVKNDKNKRWVNGSIGKIVELGKNLIRVNIKGSVFSIDLESWTKYKYVYNESENIMEHVPIGYFTQYPIKLAYAITIHKSQGRTYDKVIVDYTEGHAFAAGQTYVALSRCKSLDCLYLEEPITAEDVIFRQDIVNYYNGTFHTEVKRIPFIDKSKDEYCNSFEWLEDNRIKITNKTKPKKITGTRLSAVLNMDRYKTPFETWCAINHIYEKPFEETPFTNAGKVIESKQIEFVKKKMNSQNYKVVFPDDEYGFNAKENKRYDFFEHLEVFGGMWDSLLKYNGEKAAVFEMKTTSVKRKMEWEKNPPITCLLQAALYAWLLELDEFYIIVSFIDGKEYYNPQEYVCNDKNTLVRHFKISEIFPNFENEYIRPALRWWNDYIETGISPKYDIEKDQIILEKLKNEGNK